MTVAFRAFSLKIIEKTRAREIFYSFFFSTIIYKIMKRMRKNACSVVLCAFLLFWERGSRKLFSISKRFFLSFIIIISSKTESIGIHWNTWEFSLLWATTQNNKSFNWNETFFVHSLKAYRESRTKSRKLCWNARLRIAFGFVSFNTAHKSIKHFFPLIKSNFFVIKS